MDETREDAQFRALCREAGLADTPQRRVIYQTLRESLDHPTAEILYDRVRRSLPGVSLATVYRNLRHFADAGIVEEVATGSSFARYDANRDRHHHLICRACGSVVDYYSPEFDSIASARVQLEGFQVQDATVNVYGVCSKCAAEDEQGP